MSKRQPSEEQVRDVEQLLSLAGKVALVTGASSGIGRAIALACAQAGADVVVGYYTSERAATEVADAIRALGRRVHQVQADTSDPKDVDRLAAEAARTMGRVDAWINNAGA